jgi:DNA-binding NtrC family response regulator
MERQFSFLIVDDEASFRDLCLQFIRSFGHKAKVARDGHEALSLLRREWFDVALIDLKLPKIDGLQLVKMIKSEKPSPQIIVLTGYGSIGTAVEAMRLGAYHYVTKPLQMHEMQIVINRLLRMIQLEYENRTLREKVGQGSNRVGMEHVIGTSAPMRRVMEIVEVVSQNKAPVSIQGPVGSGKELVARAIHCQGLGADHPFVVADASQMSATMMASHLFGHVKGAFAGATSDAPGAMRTARTGTLLVDNIDQMDVELQAKLLKAFAEGQVTPIGGNAPEKLDVRLIASMEGEPAEAVSEGELCEELFTRLEAVSIVVPSLAERRSDIPLLVEHFIKRYSAEHNIAAKAIDAEAMASLVEHDWPGNIRQLEEVVRQLVLNSDGQRVRQNDLPTEIVRGDKTVQWKLSGTAVPSLEDAERMLIAMALDAAKGKKAAAARNLQIDRQRLYRKIKKYNIGVVKKSSSPA